MDLKDTLIESGKKQGKRKWPTYLISALVHSALVGLIIFIGMTATHKVAAEDKPIRAFVEAGAAPPPPPPPPPPPAASASSAPKTTPKRTSFSVRSSAAGRSRPPPGERPISGG